MISGTINSVPLTLLNNIDDPNYFLKVFNMLPEENSNVIIGGDLNCCLDLYLDRLSTSPTPDVASTRVLNNLLKLRNLAQN